MSLRDGGPKKIKAMPSPLLNPPEVMDYNPCPAKITEPFEIIKPTETTEQF